MELTPDILKALGAPFNSEELEAKPQTVSGAKALAVFYIDARIVMRRLDEICPGHWSFDFEPLTADGKMVKGKLTVCGVTRCDAGQETQTDDKTLKSAVSDALKRAAVHFGVGRYIYHLPLIWADFDAQKKQFKSPPQISDAALQRALRLAGVIDSQPARSHSSRSAAAPQAQRRDLHQEAEQALRGNEQPASSMIGNGGPGAPPAQPSMGALEPPSAPRSQGHGDTGAQRPESRGDAAASDTALLACSNADCGKPLTRGQHDVSVRAFGSPFCPQCQRTQARGAA